MNVNLLRSKMVIHEDNFTKLARALEISRDALYCKMAQKRDFKQSEIAIIVERYNLTNDEIKQIFF